MENQYVHPQNGAEVRSQDLNLSSADGALADDRTLWELLRLKAAAAGGVPQKAILPYGKSGWAPDLGPDNATALTSTALVQGNVANGSVYVLPFRAILGPLLTTPTYDVEYLRGQRSSYLLGATWHGRTVAIVANVSGNPRWDLVYAAVTPDASGDTANYVKKDPVTLVVSLVVGGVITRKTTVTVAIDPGTPGATPSKNAPPGDGGGTYYIPLAYLWIPNGFGGSSAVGRGAIYEVAPCVPIHSSTGVVAAAPANHQHAIAGTVDTNQSDTADGSLRNGAYLPPTMVGGETRWILLQLARSPLSHQHEEVVDSSIDWRFRYFRWTLHWQTGGAGNTNFASDRETTPSTPTMSTANTTNESGVGQSFVNDSSQTVTYAFSNGTAVHQTLGGAEIAIHVKNASDTLNTTPGDPGDLIISIDGTPGAQIFVWLEATGPYSNFGTV